MKYLPEHFCVRVDGVSFVMLRFWVGERHEGSAPLISDLIVAYAAR